MEKNREVLELAVLAGETLLANGAEIFRVEETIIRILESFGITDHNVYVVTNSIVASVEEQGEAPCYAVRHVEQSNLNLSRVTAVNTVSREIAAAKGVCDIPALREKIVTCGKAPEGAAWLRVLACAMGAGSFCYILGGDVWDSVAAFLAGLVLQLFLFGSQRVGMNRYIERILGGVVITICSQLLLLAGVGHSLDSVMTGVIMPLVPGVLLTTAIRDFFNSDYLSGTIHLVDALLIAASIAVGVGSTLWAWSFMQGVAL